MSTAKIAASLDLPRRVVQRTLKIWREVGDVMRDPRRVRDAIIMTPHEVTYLLTLIERTPDIYLDELVEELQRQHNISVSVATMSRTLKLLGLTNKRLSKHAEERCEETRRAFQFAISDEPPERLVFVDECAVNILTTYRLNGWSMKGRRSNKRALFGRGNRYSVLPALSLEGIIYATIKQGSFDGEAFITFLRGLLPRMNPYPAPNSVLVMDNCQIHHVEEVEDICRERGVRLLYLPPYSPDLKLKNVFLSSRLSYEDKGTASVPQWRAGSRGHRTSSSTKLWVK